MLKQQQQQCINNSIIHYKALLRDINMNMVYNAWPIFICIMTLICLSDLNLLSCTKKVSIRSLIWTESKNSTCAINFRNFLNWFTYIIYLRIKKFFSSHFLSWKKNHWSVICKYYQYYIKNFISRCNISFLFVSILKSF